MKILVLNGPNINFLGIREASVYGNKRYGDLIEYLSLSAKGHGLIVEQYNSEGDIIDALQGAYRNKVEGIVLNAGAYTHTSIALHDAIKSIGIPTIEVHLSNIHTKETFRHYSCIAPACEGVITGLGFASYRLAIEYLINKNNPPQ